jgi:hypothetical protein
MHKKRSSFGAASWSFVRHVLYTTLLIYMSYPQLVNPEKDRRKSFFEFCIQIKGFWVYAKHDPPKYCSVYKSRDFGYMQSMIPQNTILYTNQGILGIITPCQQKEHISQVKQKEQENLVLGQG